MMRRRANQMRRQARHPSGSTRPKPHAALICTCSEAIKHPSPTRFRPSQPCHAMPLYAVPSSAVPWRGRPCTPPRPHAAGERTNQTDGTRTKPWRTCIPSRSASAATGLCITSEQGNLRSMLAGSSGLDSRTLRCCDYTNFDLPVFLCSFMAVLNRYKKKR